MQNQVNNIVNCGDRICATIDCNGRRLASVNGTNFSGLESVKRALLDLAGAYVGIAMLTVRNVTRGWRDVSALATMRRPFMAQFAPSVSVTPRAGAQYLIPWAS